MSKPDYNFFLEWCKANHLPDPIPEYKFHETRRWRFDFAFLDSKLAIEVNGGVWKNGRHNRGAGYLKDLEKLNEAAACGWKVLQFTPSQIFTMYALDLIKRILI